MTTIDQFKNFNPTLQVAFVKMIKGINVELSEEGKKEYKEANVENEGRWFFIRSINEDESITLMSSTNHIFEGLRLKDIKL